jgi:amino acid permease
VHGRNNLTLNQKRRRRKIQIMTRRTQQRDDSVQVVVSTTSTTATTSSHDATTADVDNNGDVSSTPSQVVFYGDDDEDDADDDNDYHENEIVSGRYPAAEGDDGHQQAVDNEENNNASNRDVVVISYPTILGAVANLCSATLGAGVLALPFALEQAGLICGLLLLLGSAWATTVSIELLVVACDLYSLSTYEQVVQHVLGPRARQVVEGSILVFCIGCAVAYLIAVGDIVEQLLSLWIGENEGDASKDAAAAAKSRRWAIALVWMFAMLPLSCLRRMKSLQCASGVGLASIGTLLLAATVHLVQHFNDNVSPLLEDLALGSDEATGSKSLFLHWIMSVVDRMKPFVGPSKGSILSVLRACPIVLFSFSCQVNVCQIYDELPGSSKQRLGVRVALTDDDGNGIPTNNTTTLTNLEQQQRQCKVRTMSGITWTAMALCAFLYTSISVVTLMDFGALLQPNVLSCYHPTQSPRDALLHVAFAAMAVAVIMAFPLNIFPARVCIFQMCFSDQNKPQDHDDSPSIISLVQQHNGGVVPVSGGSHHDNYIIVDSSSHRDALSQPLLMRHQRDVEEQEQQHQLQRQSQPTHQEESGQGVEAVDEGDGPSSSYSSSTSQHMLVTVLVAGLALALALIVPNISIVFGLLGGTTASLLGFVIPGWLGLCLEDRSSSSSSGAASGTTIHHRRAKAWFLVVAGSVVGILTTGVTLYSSLPDLHVV